MIKKHILDMRYSLLDAVGASVREQLTNKLW